MTGRATSLVLRAACGAIVAASLVSCAQTVGSGGPMPPTVSSGPLGPETGRAWPVTTHEHVDLWLHGYAMLSRDTATVPLFARGYRERVLAAKARGNVTTLLDANRDNLAARLAANPSLVNGQFVPLYFTTFEELQQVVSQFLSAQGNPAATNDPNLRVLFGVLASSYRTPTDRDWLRLFVQALGDERTRFYHDYWLSEERARDGVRVAVDSLWRRVYLPRLTRYLDNTQLRSGEFILSLPLDGEGRTVTVSNRENAVTTSFPETPSAAVDAIYVFAHEIVSTITTPAINDNTTPAEQRTGAAADYGARASVRAGAMLLQKTAPELVPGYMAYYLRTSGAAVPSSNVAAAFDRRFPLPDAIRSAIASQLDLVLGGI